jgi:myosin heavy subunit
LLDNSSSVSDVLKQELARKAAMSGEDVNDFVIRKTISGPKRFRPLTREELENQISEFEKKTKVKSSNSTTASAGVKEPVEGASKIDRTPIVAERNGEDDSTYLLQIRELQQRIVSLEKSCDGKDKTVVQLREEVSRLRSINSQLLSFEEERDSMERQYNDLNLRHERIIEELEEAQQKLSSSETEAYQIKAEAEDQLQQQNIEIEELREQCEKGMKQNTQLLRHLAEIESHLDKNMRASLSPDPTSERNLSTQIDPTLKGGSLQEKLRAANARITVLENTLKASQSTGRGPTHVDPTDALKESLREKNEVIRELKRTIAEMSRLSRGNIIHPQRVESPQGADSVADTKPSSGRRGGGANKTSEAPFSSDAIKFLDSLVVFTISYLTSAQTTPIEIVNKLITQLDALCAGGGAGISPRTLQGLEHSVLLRFPSAGAQDEDEDDEDDLNGMKLTR